MKKLSVSFFGWILLLLFVGFYISINFFDHPHYNDGNIIVHSHPYKADSEGKPLHNHSDSVYLLIQLLNDFIAVIACSIALTTVIFLLSGEKNTRIINNLIGDISESPSLLRGPPSVLFA